MHRSTYKLTGKFLHKHFIIPQEVAPQQVRTGTVKCACGKFSIEKHHACLSTS